MSNTKKRTALSVGVAALIVLALIAVFVGGEDPAVAELQKTFDAAMANGAPPPREEMRARMDQLTDEQRSAFFEKNRGQMMERAIERMTETLQLPPDERKQAIAEQVDRLLERRASGDTSDGPRGSRPPGRGPGGGAGASQSDRMKWVLDRTTPEMRGAFTETKRLIDDELEARGEPSIHPREMRGLMRP
ncbi:MAG: hypothetical protein AAF266_12580 [Planctomycetota bacterium]